MGAVFGYIGLLNRYHLTTDRIRVIRDAGLSLGLFHEGGAGKTFNAALGKQHATDALGHAQSLGIPHGVGICPSVDYDMPTSDFAGLRAYLSAWKAVMGGMYRTGLYGPPQVLTAFRSEVDYIIQPSAWSGGKRLPGIAMWQNSVSTTLCGINVDVDEVYDASILWGVGNVTVPSDVKGTQWEEVVTWAVDNGVMFTYHDGTFKPDQPVSRGQVAASLENLYKLIKSGK